MSTTTVELKLLPRGELAPDNSKFQLTDDFGLTQWTVHITPGQVELLYL